MKRRERKAKGDVGVLDEKKIIEDVKEIGTAETWDRIRTLFLEEGAAAEHVQALTQHKVTYLTLLRAMIERRVHAIFSTVTKGRVLAACLACQEMEMARYILQHPTFLGLGELVRAVQLLDSPRQVRLAQQKLARLELAVEVDPKAVRRKTIANLKTKIHNIQQEWLPEGRFSGSRAKLVRKWVQALPPDKLEFFLLHFPADPWKSLADIIHLRKTDFQLSYFLPTIFGAKPPADSLVSAAQSCTYDTLPAVLGQFPGLLQQYSYLRKRFSDVREAKAGVELKVNEVMRMGFTRKQAILGLRRFPHDLQQCVEYILERGAELSAMAFAEAEGKSDLSEESIRIIAERAPLEELIWWYHELASPEVENIVFTRLQRGEEIKDTQRTSYGKILERVLYFRELGVKFAPQLIPYAESRLKAIELPPCDANVVVLGDASGSMDIAIKCAAALGSLLSAVFKAEMVMFNQKSFSPPVQPRTAAQAIEVVEGVKAAGGTSMAAALWPFYQNRKKVDLFLLVSDEGENDAYRGFRFAELFHKYREEIHPTSKVILVSFLEQTDPGRIKQRLQTIGIAAQQFRLDKERPDTSKFDALMGLVSLETTYIRQRVTLVHDLLRKFRLPGPVVELILQY